MEYDPDMKNRILEMDNEEMSKIITSLASAFGLHGKIADKIAANPETLKKKLGQLNDSDIEKLVGKLTDEQKSELFNRLK